MKPIPQTKFTAPDQSVHGNCFAACVASLLEIPLEDVPPLEDLTDGKWFKPFYDLLQAHGYDFGGTYYFELDSDSWQHLSKISPGVDGYYIATGPSPREWVKRGHCVIYKDGAMVHDPHPSGAGLLAVRDVLMIEPMKEDGGTTQ